MNSRKKFILTLTTAFLLSPFAGLASLAAEDKTEILPYYKLPKDPKAAVVTLNYRGGFTPPKTSDEPTMTIFADGSIVIPKKFEHALEYKGKLTESELQDLLHFIIGTNDFFKYDQDTVKDKIQQEKDRIRKAGGGIFRMADAATFELEVTANGKSNSASHYPSGMDESKIPELVHLAAIRKRLQQEMSLVQLGGKKEAEAWLAVANKELLAKHPKAEPLTMDDFNSGGKRTDGSVYVNFTRLKLDDNGKPVPNHVTGVNINKPSKGKAKIYVAYRRPEKKN